MGLVGVASLSPTSESLFSRLTLRRLCSDPSKTSDMESGEAGGYG